MTQKQDESSRFKVGLKIQVQCILLGYGIFLTTFTLIKTMGVFFIQLQTEFSASAAQISFTVGLPGAVVFMGGPAYGALFNSLGIRPTYTLAGLLMFVGFGGCFFSPTLFYTQICMGVVAGVGAGLANVSTLTLLGRAFYTCRPIALGALAMGGSTAAATGGPVLQWCIDKYTWRGAFALLGAYTLHGILFGCMIAPVYEKIIKQRQKSLIIRVLASDSTEKDEYREGGGDIISPNDSKDSNRADSICKADFERHHARIDEQSLKLTHDKPTQSFFRRKSRRRTSVYERFSSLGYNVFSVFDLSLLKNPWFLCYCTSCGFSICSRILAGLYLVRYAQAIGIGDQQAARKLSVCEIAAFLIIPFISLLTSVKQKPRGSDENVILFELRKVVSSVRRSYILGVFQIFMALVIFFSTYVEHNDGFTVYSALLGLCFGAVAPLTNVVLADLFGTKRLAGAVGYRSLASGIMLLSVPSLIGYLIDQNGSYRTAQYFTSAMSLVSGFLTLLSQAAILYTEKKDTNNNSSSIIVDS